MWRQIECDGRRKGILPELSKQRGGVLTMWARGRVEVVLSGHSTCTVARALLYLNPARRPQHARSFSDSDSHHRRLEGQSVRRVRRVCMMGAICVCVLLRARALSWSILLHF